MEQKKGKARFIRVRGRVIPIRERAQNLAVGGAGIAGAAVAADAARTKVVYKTKSLTIQRKRFSLLPMDSVQSLRPKLGSALIAKNKSGKKVGRLHFTVDNKEAEGVIDWLSVKKSERGKGISKKLAKQGALEMKAEGGKFIFTHVVHPRSAALLDGEKGVKSTYFRTYRTTDKSGQFMIGISKKEALKKAGQWNGKPVKFKIKDLGPAIVEKAKYMRLSKSAKNKYDYSGPTIYRNVKLPAKMRRQIKPFRTSGNKWAMGIGVLTAATSFGLLARGNK